MKLIWPSSVLGGGMCLLACLLATSLASGQATNALSGSVSASLSLPGEVDQYRFTLDARGGFHFDARTQANPLHWSLLGPKGIEVDGLSFSSSDGNNANDSVLRLEPGDYLLSVNALGDWTGHYEFRFSNLNSGRLIAPDTDVGGKLDPGNQTQLYQFLAAAGDQLRFKILGSTNSPSLWWRLVGPAGNYLFSA